MGHSDPDPLGTLGTKISHPDAQGCDDVLQPALGSILDRDLTKEMAARLSDLGAVWVDTTCTKTSPKQCHF